MIKPNPQIELHRAWLWTCDECGGENFERCMVRQFVSGIDPDAVDEAIADMTDEEVEELIGEVDALDDDESDDDDGDVCECGDPECDGMIAIESFSIPQILECKMCGQVYDDVVTSDEGM